MSDRFNPMVSIDRFRYADSTRTQKRRLPGSCPTLLNFAPNQGEGERIRRGFLAYSTITPPTGMQKFFILPIQSPSQEDVFLWMADSSGQKMYQNPYWMGGGTKVASNIQIDETKSFTGVAGSVATKVLTITGSDALGLSSTTDYYRGWVLKNTTQTEYAYVKSYSYSSAAAGTSAFTLIETITAGGLNWLVTNAYTLYRNFHDNLTFAPTYNNNLTSPPFALSDISKLYFSGGQSSAAGNAALWSGYISRTFFPSSADTYSYTGTYVSEERLRGQDFFLSSINMVAPTGGQSALETDRTYWFAHALIYDGFQLGELYKYETPSQYTLDSNQNYVSTTDSKIFAAASFFKPALLNRRITGIAIFVAQDLGDTRTTGRENAYEFVDKRSFVDADVTAFWTFSTPYFGGVSRIGLEKWQARLGTYIEASGMEETPPDTSYSYSSRLVLNEKHYLSNVYINSEGVTNREEIFTNPRGGLVGINSGVNQPSLFPNDLGFFRKGIELSIGTKINAMAKVDLGELLTIKDRGLILNRIIEETDGTIQVISKIIDQNVGCSTLNGFTQLDADDGGLIFFAGYDDMYIYQNGNFKRLIEREDQQDWLYQYREGLSKTDRENAVLTYLPEGILLVDFNPTSYVTGKQYQLYTQYISDGWRQVAFKQTSGFASTTWFTQFGKLQSGTVIGLGTNSGGTLTLYQFSSPTTGEYYYTDAGSHIRSQFDTGELVTAGDMSLDTWLDRYQIGRYMSSPMQGTLDCEIYKDGVLLRTLSGMDKTSVYLKAAVRSDDPKIGNTWRLKYNVNTSTPETLNAGTDFRIQGIRIYGHSKIRKRISDAGYSSGIGDCVPNTIAGSYEVYVDEADTTKTWDNPFTLTYVDLDGATVPMYRFLVESATVDGQAVPNEEIAIVSKSLTQIVLRAAQNHTKVKFKATE